MRGREEAQSDDPRKALLRDGPEIQHAEFGFLSKLPLALSVRIVQLSRQLLRILVLLHRLRPISKAQSLGSAETQRRDGAAKAYLPHSPLRPAQRPERPLISVSWIDAIAQRTGITLGNRGRKDARVRQRRISC